MVSNQYMSLKTSYQRLFLTICVTDNRDCYHRLVGTKCVTLENLGPENFMKCSEGRTQVRTHSRGPGSGPSPLQVSPTRGPSPLFRFLRRHPRSLVVSSPPPPPPSILIWPAPSSSSGSGRRRLPKSISHRLSKRSLAAIAPREQKP